MYQRGGMLLEERQNEVQVYVWSPQKHDGRIPRRVPMERDPWTQGHQSLSAPNGPHWPVVPNAMREEEDDDYVFFLMKTITYITLLHTLYATTFL